MRVRGLKLSVLFAVLPPLIVAPMRVRGLKFFASASPNNRRNVAPMRVRGLKYAKAAAIATAIASRTHAGAWIEMYKFTKR